jgi:hypothetical protein
MWIASVRRALHQRLESSTEDMNIAPEKTENPRALPRAFAF